MLHMPHLYIENTGRKNCPAGKTIEIHNRVAFFKIDVKGSFKILDDPVWFQVRNGFHI